VGTKFHFKIKEEIQDKKLKGKISESDKNTTDRCIREASRGWKTNLHQQHNLQSLPMIERMKDDLHRRVKSAHFQTHAILNLDTPGYGSDFLSKVNQRLISHPSLQCTDLPFIAISKCDHRVSLQHLSNQLL
jgi:hypothetical protein